MGQHTITAMTSQASLALMKFLSDLARQLGVGKHTYVVGGAVRNFVISQPIKDIDVVIDSVALKGKDSAWFAEQVAKAIPVQTKITTNQYGVALLHIVGDWMLGDTNLKGEDIEIANARKESYADGGYTPDKVEPADIYEDTVRREFTFNTLLWRLHDLADGPDKAEILDLTGCGLRDLQEGVMRCPTSPDKTFSDDPSRMIRAIKFLIKYGFTISLEVKRSIEKNKAKLKNIPHAHLSNMLINTFLRESTGKKALLEMQKLGLLDVIKEIAQTQKPFREALANWADKEAKVEFLFDLMDFGLPSGKRLSFLSPMQQQQVRDLTVGMTHQEADQYLQVLTQPGKVLDTKALMLEFNLSGAEARQITDVARGVLLTTPELASHPVNLTARVRMGLAPGVRIVAKTFELNPGDPILYGKFLNKPGTIQNFGQTEKGDPTILVESIHGGPPKELKLFKVRYDEGRAPVVAAISDCRYSGEPGEVRVPCPVSEEVRAEALLRPLGILGDTDGFTVWLVNGSVLRDAVDIDFTNGGNPAVYGYIPEDEVWVEDFKGPRKDVACTLLHELIEMILMRRGWTYNDAHERASEVEDTYRTQEWDVPEGRIVPLVMELFQHWESQESPVSTNRIESKMVARLAAKYQNKKTVKTKDGDDAIVYEYSEKQVQNRNREKAERVEKLRGNLHKLQSQVTKDLKSEDTHTRLCALAVGLMNDTYERVGNDESAKDGHVGVTGWTPEHIKFGDGKATITYVGKSGVKHEKVTKDSNLIRVMKEAVKDKKKGDTIFTYEDGRVDASAVNDYLDELDLGITAKDIRGLHANREMQDRLKAVRSKGGKLPEDKKEREKKLKDEFKEALEGAAEAVGHEPATLKSQYLVPGLEDTYLKDGTVMDKLHEKKSSLEEMAIRRVAARYLAKRQWERPQPGYWVQVLNLKGEEKSRHWLEDFQDAQQSAVRQSQAPDVQRVVLRDRTNLPMKAFVRGKPVGGSQDKVVRKLAALYLATKTDAQKEDKDIRQMLKKDPKKKPIREDLRRNRMRTEDADLASESEDDLSLNYKKVADRLISRWVTGANKRQQKKNQKKQDKAKPPEPPEPPKPPTGPKPPGKPPEKPKEPEHKPGDVWKSESGKWTALNPDGNSHTFEEKPPAEAYAKGKALDEDTPPPDDDPNDPNSDVNQPPPDDDPNDPNSDVNQPPPAKEKAPAKDPTKALGEMADALASASGKKIDKAKADILKQHPELEAQLKEQFSAYEAANSELAKAAIKAEGLSGKEKKDAIKALDAAEAKRKDAIEKIRTLKPEVPKEPAKKEEAPAKEPEEAPAEEPEKPTEKPAPDEDTDRAERSKALADLAEALISRPDKLDKLKAAILQKYPALEAALEKHLDAYEAAKKELDAAWDAGGAPKWDSAEGKALNKKIMALPAYSAWEEAQIKIRNLEPEPEPEPEGGGDEDEGPDEGGDSKGDLEEKDFEPASPETGEPVETPPEATPPKSTPAQVKQRKEVDKALAKALENLPKGPAKKLKEQLGVVEESPEKTEAEKAVKDAEKALSAAKKKIQPEVTELEEQIAAFQGVDNAKAAQLVDKLNEVRSPLRPLQEKVTEAETALEKVEEATADTKAKFVNAVADAMENAKAVAQSEVVGKPVTKALMEEASKDPFKGVDWADPASVAAALAKQEVTQKILLDPSSIGGQGLSDEALDEDNLTNRAEAALNQFRHGKAEVRKQVAETAAAQLADLEPDSPQAKELNRIIDGLQLAMIANGEQMDIKGPDGEPLRQPLDPKQGLLARQMIAQGKARVLLADSTDHHAAREAVRDAMGYLGDGELQEMAKGTPWEPLGDLLGGLGGMTLDPEVAELLRGLIRDLGINNMTTNQGLINAVAGKKMPASTPAEAAEAVAKQFSHKSLQEGSRSLVQCLQEAKTLDAKKKCVTDQGKALKHKQVQEMWGNMEKAAKAAGVELDLQDPHVAAVRHAAETGDLSILDEKLEPARTFEQQRAEFIKHMKNPEERARVQKMTPQEFKEMQEGIFGGNEGAGGAGNP